jgi:hypothetical protein
MAVPSTTRRLFVHSAHRSIGVSTEGIALRPYCRLAGSEADPHDAPSRRVVLATCGQDSEASAALALFERAMDGRNDLEYRRVQFHSTGAGSRDFADADCVVMLGRGLQIVRRWADLDATLPSLGSPSIPQHRPTRIEIAAGPWHPILEGVEPFASQQSHRVDGVRIAENATLLLVARSTGQTVPAAWIEHRHYGSAFCTSLGTLEDFHRPAFIRLVANAIDWVGGDVY